MYNPTPCALWLVIVAVGTSLSCGDDRRSVEEDAGGPDDEASTAREPAPESAPTGATRQRTVYVPAYSHLPRGPRMRNRSLLSILLSVRNVDSTATITLTHVDYFDTSGHRVRRYLSSPRALRPLETAEFTVPMQDEAGGSGANFLVYWEGPSDAHSLLAEAVMLAYLDPGYSIFTSRGVELDRRPSSTLFTTDLRGPPKTSDGGVADADGVP